MFWLKKKKEVALREGKNLGGIGEEKMSVLAKGYV